MVLSSKNGNVLWNSKTNGNTGGYTLVLQNDANLVLYSGGKSKWATNTDNACDGRLYLYFRRKTKRKTEETLRYIISFSLGFEEILPM